MPPAPPGPSVPTEPTEPDELPVPTEPDELPVPTEPAERPVPSEPGSGPRLRPLRPAELSPAQAEVYGAITGGPRSNSAFDLTDGEGRLRGPFDAMLRSPEVGGALQALGSALRFSGVLPARARELAILAVAAAEDSAFERQAHEAVARQAGVGEEVLAALRQGTEPDLDDRVERVVLTAARSLLAEGVLDDQAFGEAVAELGEQGVFELTTLVGYYRTLALQLRVFGAGTAGRS